MQDSAPNRLAGATSPYLLDHATNPVRWWPWCDEAFAEARRRGVPVFLSIGYSTCYWCHVMARESFEDAGIAAVLNERFVCIKVDREERPDVDDAYMTATVVSTGHGGWPMSVFVEPEQRRPFYCGTYFPPRPGMRGSGVPSIVEISEGIANAWNNDRERVLESADAMASAVLNELNATTPPRAIEPGLIERLAAGLVSTLDRVDGGFGAAPKFPQPVNLAFLLDARERAPSDDARTAIDVALRLTLDRMACGGIFDHVGGGFHRYAVDRNWTVPHFEKMLYDNAQLLAVFARAARCYESDDYERVARRIVDCIDRDFTAEDGAFCSALDAEVEGHEGLNYLWTADEAGDVLRSRDTRVLSWYGLDGPPNFQDPHHPEDPPAHVVRMSALPGIIAAEEGLGRAEVVDSLDAANSCLLDARLGRAQPRLDDKVLAAWNGLMIEGLAVAAIELEELGLLDRAERAASAILGRLGDGEGGLLRVSRKGASHTSAFLEDRAMLAVGLCAVVRAGRVLGRPSERWLAEAEAIVRRADPDLASGDGGYFDAPSDAGELFVRPRTTYDGAMPTGQSAMLHALLDLSALTGDPTWSDRAMTLLGSLSGPLTDRGLAMLHAARGVMRVFDDDALRQRAEQLGPSASPPAAVASEDFTPVEVYADRDSVSLAPDQPGELRLRISIAPGFHIAAADPGESDAARMAEPLRVFLLQGSGVEVYADMPEGKAWGAEGEGELLVLRGEVEIRVALEQTGRAEGRPLLGVRFQACDERSCRAPTTVELDVSIDTAPMEPA